MTFTEFYEQHYLPRHADPTCKWMHVAGLVVTAAWAGVAAGAGSWWLWATVPAPAYLLGSLGHVLARNQPTYLRHPVYAFGAYWKMLADMIVAPFRGNGTTAAKPTIAERATAPAGDHAPTEAQSDQRGRP